ncbi:MAG: CoA transferase [Rhodospirillaceae bacterium]|nr:CoA transferase [Rhodospirillaceae bacterium]
MAQGLPTPPLKGVKVLDLGQIYNGPYAGFLLAHGGADVVKVEPIGGEALRKRGGLGVPLSFSALNTNKRGIALNLKAERGKALLIEMAEQADVLLENFAPGAMERLGVGPDVLMDANPRLIYASGTGYGLTGPDKDNLAMGLTVQAVGGVMGINGPADGPPLKTGLAICDFLGGVHLYSGIMTALYERSVTGQGRLVEIAMQEALYPALASNVASMHNNGWKQPERRGNRHPTRGSAPYNVYECVDGHVAIICVTEVHWTNLLDVVGRSELADDPRFATQALRAQHEDEVDAAVAPWLRERSKYEVAATLKENRVPAAPVRDLLEVTADAHMHERGMLHYVEHPEMGKVVLPSSPLRFAGSTPPGLLLEPDIGQHTDAILSDWLGMEAISVAALKVDGVVG